MIHGFNPSQIYFQYDIFLSLLATFWMKMNMDINHFQVLGQISFYLLFVGAFLFSRKWFSNKNLSIYFLVVLVIIRYYAVDGEPVALFQITPLRLDLWFILLMLVYFKGPHHWLTGVVLGALILLHKNFGLIYLISYAGLISTLALADFSFGKKRQSFIPWIKKHFFLNIKNALIILLFIAASTLIFKGFVAESAVLYQKIGFGMLPISASSFYWYVPVLFGAAAMMLAKQRHVLPPRYFSTGIFLLFLALGNSIYFFGRSHENNILNISGALVFSLFMTIDLMNFTVKKTKARKEDLKLKKGQVKQSKAQESTIDRLKKIAVANALPWVLVLGSVYFYSGRIAEKAGKQYTNISHLQFVYPMPAVPRDFTAVKVLTHNSPDVYFLNYYDFTYYYYGNYTPLGYYAPLAACPFVKDVITFSQDLLNRHYYLVTNSIPDVIELFPKLNYNRVVEKDGFTVISKENTELLLPVNPLSLIHIGIADSLAKSGLQLPPLKVKDTFTMEIILNPSLNQVDYATVLSTVTDADLNRGFILQQVKDFKTQYVFAFRNVNKEIITIGFSLPADTWNYLAITMWGDKIKIYNNGKLLVAQANTSPILNSNEPLSVGDVFRQTDRNFSGYIKEIKVTNGGLSEEDVLKNYSGAVSKLKVGSHFNSLRN